MSGSVIRPDFTSPSSSDSPLFDDVAEATDHDIAMALGRVNRPKLPLRWGHPITALFDSCTDAEYAKLREDIRVNGQKKAIAMYQGYIWDGRARYEAALSLGLVPNLWIMRARDPILYLIHRHDPSRYGAPNTPERHAAIEKLNRLYSPEWKARAEKDRADWLKVARDEFRQLFRPRLPCAVCGMDREYSHAHHVLPLNVQYDLGFDSAVQDHAWLCHVHHKAVHRLFAAELRPTRRNDGAAISLKYGEPPERVARLMDVFNQGFSAFLNAGGIAERGNWSFISP